jgi:hypothetical protein
MSTILRSLPLPTSFQSTVVATRSINYPLNASFISTSQYLLQDITDAQGGQELHIALAVLTSVLSSGRRNARSNYRGAERRSFLYVTVVAFNKMLSDGRCMETNHSVAQLRTTSGERMMPASVPFSSACTLPNRRATSSNHSTAVCSK